MPPTPLEDLKGKGKQKEQSRPSPPPLSFTHLRSAPSRPSSPPPSFSNPLQASLDTHQCPGDTSRDSEETSAANSPGATGALSKTAQRVLGALYPQVEQLIVDTSVAAGIPVKRVSKLLAQRIVPTMHVSSGTWNGYQSFFTAHTEQELGRIHKTLGDYNSTPSPKKKELVLEAQEAFKEKYGEGWKEIIQTWKELNVVTGACKGQSHGTWENEFNATNRQVVALVSLQFSLCSCQRTDHAHTA